VSNLSCPGGDRTHGDGTAHTWVGYLRGLLRVACGFGPCARLVFATGSPGDTANSPVAMWKEAMGHLGVFLTAWKRRCGGSGLGAELCGIADDAFLGPGGRLVFATGSPGDTASSSGVERSHGPFWVCF
jgi:hypothetical protein